MESPIHPTKPGKKRHFSRDQRDAILLLSHKYLHYGKTKEAKELLMGIHAARPRDISILPLLAYAQLHCHKPRVALRIMNELRRRDWKHPEYYLLMAQILQELDEREASRKHYKRYLNLVSHSQKVEITESY